MKPLLMAQIRPSVEVKVYERQNSNVGDHFGDCYIAFYGRM
jgi:hypothetical protein